MAEKRIFDYKEVENAAAETQTTKAFCERIGISPNNLGYHKKKNPEFTTAYERGCARRDGKEVPVEAAPVAKTELQSAPVGKLTTAEILEVETPENMTYSEIETKILTAIENFYCTLSQIKKHCDFEMSFDISGFLQGMEMDAKIRRVDNGTITAFFLKRWRVKRFWLNGDGKVAVEFETGQKGAIVRKSPVKTEPRFENTVKHITENGHSRESIEKVKADLVSSLPPPILEQEPAGDEPRPATTTQVKTVEIDGGELLFGFKGNIFEVGRESRQKLNQIIDLVQEL